MSRRFVFQIWPHGGPSVRDTIARRMGCTSHFCSWPGLLWRVDTGVVRNPANGQGRGNELARCANRKCKIARNAQRSTGITNLGGRMIVNAKSCSAFFERTQFALPSARPSGGISGERGRKKGWATGRFPLFFLRNSGRAAQATGASTRRPNGLARRLASAAVTAAAVGLAMISRRKQTSFMRGRNQRFSP